MKTERAWSPVEAVGIDLLELHELVVAHQETEDVGGIEEIFHAVLLLAARQPGGGGDGELDALVGAQDMVYDGALARTGGRGEDQYFVAHPFKWFCNHTKISIFHET